MGDIKDLMNLLGQNFDSVIWRRGKEYYSEGRIKNIVLHKGIISAICEGNSDYKLKIVVKTKDLSCTCPYYGRCKHLAALVLHCQNNDVFKSDDLHMILNEKTKEELAELLKIIFLKEPGLINDVLMVNEEDARSLIKQLWLRRYEDIGFFYDRSLKIIRQLSVLNDESLNYEFLIKLNDVSDRVDDEEVELALYELLEEFAQSIEMSKKQRLKFKKLFKDKDFEEIFS